jgi:AcrR family transcriptional regulator
MSASAPDPASATPRFTAKGLATRARIIEVAAGLMFEKGVASTSLDDIHRAAKVSGSQMYHYFGDKQTLVREVIAKQTHDMLAKQRPVLDHLDSFEALEQWRDNAVADRDRVHCKGGCGIGSLASELAEAGDDVRGNLVEGFEQWEALLRDALTSMRDRGVLRPDAHPDDLATAMLAAIQGGILLAQVRRTSAPLHLAMTAMIDHIKTFAAE